MKHLLAGHKIHVHKIRMIKHLAKNALGQQMLNQHLFHGLQRDIGVNGLTAESGKIPEGFGKALVALAFRVDELQQPPAKFRHFVFECLYRLLPFFVVRGLVFEKGFERVNKAVGLG
jgi:hypothetical protein